jgi:hypothetical protein
MRSVRKPPPAWAGWALLAWLVLAVALAAVIPIGAPLHP